MIKIIIGEVDWWSFGATIFSGIIAAIATIVAVVYSNYKSNEHFKEQEEKYRLERKQQFQESKFVVLKPTQILMPVINLLDRLIMQNDYNRVLLYSGEDGFDFFDDFNKRTNQTCRLLLIENKSEMDIKNIKISTESVLRNMNTDEQIAYKTQNVASLLRGKESIVLRLANQEQFEKIIAMNNASIPSLFRFECIIEYLTLAEQKIRYVYRININNDRRIEIECDGIEDIQDNVQYKTENPTIFRNLQDYISSIDRSSYAWEKMGQAQMKGILAQYNPQGNRTENKEKEE